MEKTWDSIKKYKKEFILGPIFKIVEVVFELMIPFLMKYMINTGIPSFQNYEGVGKILYPGLIIIAFCIFGFLSTLVCQYFASVASQGFGTDLRNRIFLKVNSLSLKDIDNFGRGNLINLITNDTTRVQTGIAMLIRLAIRAPVLVIGSLVCSFIIDYRVGLMFLILIPIISLILAIILTKNSKNYLRVQQRLDDISNYSNDSLKGSRVIRAFNKENTIINQYKNKTEKYFKETKKANLVAALINPLTFLVVNIGIMLVIYFGGNLTINNELTNGDLVALISYLNQILMALIVVSNLVIIFTKAFSSQKRIDQLLQSETSIVNYSKYKDISLNYGDEFINFENVSFKYEDDGNEVISNINFKINKGEKIGIIGGTGSGKTTLIKLIERFYDVTSGELLYKGHDIKDYDLDKLHQEISLVNQRSVLFNGTIKSNILIGKKDATDEEIINALKNSEAYKFVKEYSDFINHEVYENGKNFSGGQKQRLSLARALIKDSELLILDDSTSALDYLTDKNVRENINKMKDLTVIFISQRTSSIQHCDKIIVVDNGKIDAIGTHEELLNTSLIYKEIYDSQVKGSYEG
ncbi:MAG: ABC transporter ATP-binding protein/permease [Mollicutes bacterium]|nr:ABC transporter ATP-binding protein/permease [Mollicutes bacterium]